MGREEVKDFFVKHAMRLKFIRILENLFIVRNTYIVGQDCNTLDCYIGGVLELKSGYCNMASEGWRGDLLCHKFMNQSLKESLYVFI